MVDAMQVDRAPGSNNNGGGGGGRSNNRRRRGGGRGGGGGRNGNRGRGGGRGGRGGNNNNNGPKKHQNGSENNNSPNKKIKHEQQMIATQAPSPNSTGEAPSHITQSRFADLQISASSRRALKEVFQYEFMTVVQKETLPLILTGEDCLAKAKTGTGKTLGFMIPAIESMTQKSNTNPQVVRCLVISPTRELALQITAETEKLTRFHKQIRVVTCVGGTNVKGDLRALKESVQIVVATPGRLLDHLQNNGLAQRMAGLDTLIMDEADQLLDMGFRPDIERILRLLNPSEASRQTLLFSATVPTSVSEIAALALRPKFHFVDTVGEESEQTHQHVRQEVFVSSQEMQIQAIMSLLERETKQGGYKIMVFFTTARLTGFMAELFNSISDKTGFDVLEIHSRKSQSARKKASDRFRSAKNAVMFSSDVSARGMDYPDVTFVLQIGLTDRAQYIHRLGRTARAGKEGNGALLLASYEENFMVRKELKGMPLQKTEIPAVKDEQLIQFALRKVEQDDGLKVTAQQAYRAWLGYYNGALRKVGWDKRELVVQANNWARDIGLKDQVGLQKKTIGKMGLKGVPGLLIER